MGNTPVFSGGGNNEHVEALQKETGLNESTARAVHKSFKKHHPSGQVSQAEFAEVLRAGGIGSEVLHKAFWRALNPKGAASIGLAEFGNAVALVQRGDAKQRLALTFELCDLDGDGFIARQELLDVVTEVHVLVGQLVSHSGRVFATPADFVEHFFHDFDVDSTGRISRAAFEASAYKSLDVVAALGLYGSQPVFVSN